MIAVGCVFICNGDELHQTVFVSDVFESTRVSM